MQETFAIQGLTVGETVIGQEVRIGFRLVIGRVPVVAQTGDEREAVAEVVLVRGIGDVVAARAGVRADDDDAEADDALFFPAQAPPLSSIKSEFTKGSMSEKSASWEAVSKTRAAVVESIYFCVIWRAQLAMESPPVAFDLVYV